VKRRWRVGGEEVKRRWRGGKRMEEEVGLEVGLGSGS